MNKLFLTFVMALGLLAGCASTTTSTPQQVVFAAKSGYASALTAAVTYKRLPACKDPVILPCSDAAVVAQLQKADNVASIALDAAESAVRTPQVGASAMDKAIAAANAALVAFNAIILSIGSK